MKKYEWVLEYIYRSVQTGNLKQGDYLPSVRLLAQRIHTSTTSVKEAYERLAEQEIVESVERKGFRLINPQKIPSKKQYEHHAGPVVDIQRSYTYLSNKADDNVVKLGESIPGNKLFPSAELGKCLARVAHMFPEEININGYARNEMKARFAIEEETRKYIYNVHGFAVSCDEICQTNGAMEAMLYALRALTNLGDRVAVESPGFPGVFINLSRLHLKPLEIRTNFPDGIDLDDLEQKLQDGVVIKCLIVTPNYQNPTGATMPVANRHRLLKLSKQYGFFIIEDDALGALRVGERLPTLKEINFDDVVYISSYSKTIAPGYRVGWVAGGKYAVSIQRWHRVEAPEDSLIGHLVMMEYLKSNKYLAHIRKIQELYQKNRDVMIGLLREHFPAGTQITTPIGGQYLWLTLPPGMSSTKVFYEVQKDGILLAPGILFGDRIDHSRSMRICYAMDISQRVADAIETVGTLI